MGVDGNGRDGGGDDDSGNANDAGRAAKFEGGSAGDDTPTSNVAGRGLTTSEVPRTAPSKARPEKRSARGSVTR
jgi:hypothetical protein